MSAIPSRDIGDLERFGNHAGSNDDGSVRAAFTNLAGAATDPTAVTLAIQKPDGTQLAYGWPAPGADGLLTKESTGRFYVDVALTQPRRWRFNLSGTGAVQASTGDGELWVQASFA